MRHPEGTDGDKHGEERTKDTSAAAHGVVVGIDGSGTSWDAFYWACGEALRRGASIVAVFVDQNPAADLAMAGGSFAGAATASEAAHATPDLAGQLDDQIHRYAIASGIDHAFVSTRGDKAKELVRIARSHRADLIVVGRSTKARHHLAGSLGRKLVAIRDAPVIVVVP